MVGLKKWGETLNNVLWSYFFIYFKFSCKVQVEESSFYLIIGHCHHALGLRDLNIHPLCWFCLFVFYSYHFFMVTWEIYTPEESALWSLSSRLDALAFINSQDVTSLHKSCTRIWTFIKITSDSKLSFFNTFSQIKDFHWNKAALVQWLITCRKTNWRKPDQ